MHSYLCLIYVYKDYVCIDCDDNVDVKFLSIYLFLNLIYDVYLYVSAGRGAIRTKPLAMPVDLGPMNTAVSN